jgi:hypothetical protein
MPPFLRIFLAEDPLKRSAPVSRVVCLPVAGTERGAMANGSWSIILAKEWVAYLRPRSFDPKLIHIHVDYDS